MYQKLLVSITLILFLSSCSLIPYKNFKIMQNGMYPTIPKGKTIWVKKNPYQNVNGVKYGDIVVFTRIVDNVMYDYIWRIVALPGDTIKIENSRINLNSKDLELTLIDSDSTYNIFEEKNSESSYLVVYMKNPDSSITIPEGILIVPENEFFVMGDNRNNAYDSRYHGTIKFESITAKVNSK